MKEMALISVMKDQGSSLVMDWGEDDNRWTVSWITGGFRYTRCGDTLWEALESTMDYALRCVRNK